MNNYLLYSVKYKRCKEFSEKYRGLFPLRDHERLILKYE